MRQIKKPRKRLLLTGLGAESELSHLFSLLHRTMVTHTSVMMLETIKNIGLAFISATPLLVCGAYCHCERLWREDCASRLRTSSLCFLALIALYHNTRPLPQRGNKTPLQLAGVDLGDDDWVRLIEHEMCYGQAAQRI
jgi:hypothetical protein